MPENKGFVVFFVNINEKNQSQISLEEYINLIRKYNAETIDVLGKQGYPSLFMPCFDEACRVQKIDIDSDAELPGGL